MQNAHFSRPLTAKQSRFIDEYMVDMNGAAAAVRCGYSQRTSRAIACELLTKPDIQAELQARGAELARELEITRAGVVKNLLEVFHMSRELKNPAAMISSMSTIAKILGFYSPEVKRVELSAQQGAAHAKYTSMTDAQLLALIACGGGGAAAA
jgi:phage terminase small subunit